MLNAVTDTTATAPEAAETTEVKGRLKIAIPRGMTAQDVAEVFTAYLLGAGASGNENKQHGPFLLEPERWQLDGSNDYWMREEDGAVSLSCRYGGQFPVVTAMCNLFRARFRTN